MVIDATVAVKFTVVAPDATVTLAGTVALALLLDSATASPPLGAAPLNVTAHAEVPGAFTLAGSQLTPLTVTAATKLIVVFAVCPFKPAVTVAAWLLLTVPAVATKVPLIAPLIVTLAGTLRVTTLLDKLTVVALVAVPVSVTVQVEVCALPSVVGEQLTADSCGCAVRFSETVGEAPLALAVKTAV